MADIITSLLTNAQTLLIVVLFYIVALWLMFCLWVFVDAMRRFQNTFVALLLTLLTFVFNFPALVFYLIIRPEEPVTGGKDATVGGTNVPLMNFVDETGEVQFSLNLKVAQSMQSGADMELTINRDEQAVKSIPVESSFNVSTSQEQRGGIKDRLAGFKARAGGSFKQALEKSRRKVEDYSRTIDTTDQEVESVAEGSDPRSAKVKRK